MLLNNSTQVHTYDDTLNKHYVNGIFAIICFQLIVWFVLPCT